jgi:hypothetical protein
MRKLTAFAAVVVVSSSACGGSGSSNDGTLPPDGGADGSVDVGSGVDAPQPACAAKGDMPFHWVKRITTGTDGAHFDRGADGSILVVGSLSSANFGVDDPSPVHLESKLGTSDSDYFVARFTSDAALVFAKSGGSTDEDGAKVSAGASDGSVFVAGLYKGIATFGKGEPNETTLTATATQGQFLAKLGPDGALAWVKKFEGSGTSEATPGALFVEGDGSLRLSGSLHGTVVFGKGEPNETSLTEVSGDYFIARYDGATGALTWAKRIQTLSATPAMTSDGAGNVLFTAMAGIYPGTCTLAPGEPGAIPITQRGPFFAKYDDKGEPVATSVFLTSGVSGGHIVWSADGSWTVTGSMCGGATTVVFGQGEANETTFVCASDPVAFAARYGVDGKLGWAKKLADPGKSYGLGLGVPSDGSVRVMGTFGALGGDFGIGEPSAVKLPGNCIGTNCSTPFLAHYEANGAFTLAKPVSADNPGVLGMDVTPDGVITLVGISQKAVFGKGEPTQTTFAGVAGLPTMFVARYENCP